MSSPADARPRVHVACAPHRLVVDAEPAANALLRLLEPFVIHDVLPHRIDVADTGDALSVELEFSCDPEVAERLEARLATMVAVRGVALRLAGVPASVAA